MAFDQAIAEKIIDQICSGKSLRKIAADSSMPKPATVILWAAENPQFAEQYARAMLCRREVSVDRLDDIGDQVLAGEITPEQARVAADIVKWQASKLLPKKYGDRVINEHDGKLEVTIRDLSKE